ncbi:glycosyl hydrolase, partial [Marivirga lumbricoides]
EQLEEFWRKGMERMGDTETIVSIGMRGDGDEPMTEGTAIELLENIVKRQREIIAETTGKPASQTPQMWALYKEVQDYYDKGMRVPDDVTLLLCDDNWGNIRKLPDPQAAERSGGYGIYYHYDYVGGPRNYKWLNTNQIERTWEQMNLAYEHNVKKVWIVNVGDIKPMEFPTQFFLDLAWNPEAFTAPDLPDYYVSWATEIFGKEQAKGIAEIMQLYTKYNARRKPELLNADTYSLVHYNEAERVNNEYQELLKKAESVKKLVPSELQDAYYQLVYFPVAASANLNELYFVTAKNRLYAKQGRALTNSYAEKAEELFQKDAALTQYYHTELADGKWNHMMSQTHIGYTYWQQPEVNAMPEIKKISLTEKAKMGVSISGSAEVYPISTEKAILPNYDSFNRPQYEIEIFNKGKKPFDFQLSSNYDWIKVSEKKGKIEKQEKIMVSIDWSKASEGESTGEIIIKGAGDKVEVSVPVNKIGEPIKPGFLETNGYVSIHAENYSDKRETDSTIWITIPNLGKTKSSVSTSPAVLNLGEDIEKSPRLSYNINFLSEGEVKVHLYFSPTLNYTAGNGFKYAVGFDNEKPLIVNFHEDTSSRAWNQSVANNIKILTTSHHIKKGNHTLNYYALHNGLVLQKIVIDTGGLRETYLGPPQSFEIN